MFKSEIESNEKYINIIPYEWSFTLPFEKLTFGREEAISKWAHERIYIPMIISIVYGIAVYFGRKWMRFRPAFELRKSLVAWNVCLAVFSILGSIRMVPDLVYVLRYYGFTISVCHAYGYSGVTGFWAILFVASKPLELGDTLFIILRKQHLQLLHWYHHMTVMVFCWWTWSFQMSTARWFCIMNYVVHAFMYTYFALRAARCRLPRWVAMGVTSLQLLQMVLGMTTLVHSLVRFENGAFCHITRPTAITGILIYLSYFILFSDLFYKNYLVGPSSKSLNSHHQPQNSHLAQANGHGDVSKRDDNSKNGIHKNGALHEKSI
jgi:elongation of very long chain fatty acids protein 6